MIDSCGTVHCPSTKQLYCNIISLQIRVLTRPMDSYPIFEFNCQTNASDHSHQMYPNEPNAYMYILQTISLDLLEVCNIK